MTEGTATVPTEVRPRRRASRDAGPTGDGPAGAAATVQIPVSGTVAARVSRPARRPPRRAANSRLVGIVAAAAGLVATAVLGALVAVLVIQQRDADAKATRDQGFVDAGRQAVVNMFSYTQDTVDESVDRFVGGTSGPLRDTMSGNADNLKALFRQTHASSEAVINAAALEGVDDVAGNASVLVATRVTVTDIDGVNKPSQPYRLRLIVHEDDAGTLTAYDLKYPDGGN
ncbi:MAG: mammalian cell entry protein [Mycobacterium sp.]